MKCALALQQELFLPIPGYPKVVNSFNLNFVNDTWDAGQPVIQDYHKFPDPITKNHALEWRKETLNFYFAYLISALYVHPFVMQMAADQADPVMFRTLFL